MVLDKSRLIKITCPPDNARTAPAIEADHRPFTKSVTIRPVFDDMTDTLPRPPPSGNNTQSDNILRRSSSRALSYCTTNLRYVASTVYGIVLPAVVGRIGDTTNGSDTLTSKKRELERGDVEPETEINRKRRTTDVRKTTPANMDVIGQPGTSGHVTGTRDERYTVRQHEMQIAGPNYPL